MPCSEHFSFTESLELIKKLPKIKKNGLIRISVPDFQSYPQYTI